MYVYPKTVTFLLFNGKATTVNVQVRVPDEYVQSIPSVGQYFNMLKNKFIHA